MFIRRLIPALIIIIAGFSLPAQAQSNSGITIQGTGYALPHHNHPVTIIKVYDKATMTLLNLTTTDPYTGNYSLIIYPLGINNKPKLSEPRLKNNPYDEAAEIQLWSNQGEKWTVEAYGSNGNNLLTRAITFSEGMHRLSLEGLGAAGMKVITLDNGINHYSLEAIQKCSSSLTPCINTTDIQIPMKSMLSGDSLKMTFFPLDIMSSIQLFRF